LIARLLRDRTLPLKELLKLGLKRLFMGRAAVRPEMEAIIERLHSVPAAPGVKVGVPSKSQVGEAAVGSGLHARTPELDLTGVWKLTGFDLVDGRGSAEPWCEGAHGFIRYFSGQMSVDIKCLSNPE